jgi:hypothetical protein
VNPNEPKAMCSGGLMPLTGDVGARLKSGQWGQSQKAMGSYSRHSMPNTEAIASGFDGLARLNNSTLRQSGGTNRQATGSNIDI